MGRHARIGDGVVRIDTVAWLDRLTAGQLPDLTDDLRAWALRRPSSARATASAPRGATAPHTAPHTAPQNASDAVPRTSDGTSGDVAGYAWRRAALSWCAVRGHRRPDARRPDAAPTVIVHTATRLDRPLWLALASTADRGPIVVAQVGRTPPVVHAAATTEPVRWYDADTVVVHCPRRHRWIWRTGREMLGADGRATTLTRVFGPDLEAPFTRCPDCFAVEQGQRRGPCGCDGASWILCPTCGERCDVDLLPGPGVPPTGPDPVGRSGRPDRRTG